jgi:hypothetical protein
MSNFIVHLQDPIWQQCHCCLPAPINGENVCAMLANQSIRTCKAHPCTIRIQDSEIVEQLLHTYIGSCLYCTDKRLWSSAEWCCFHLSAGTEAWILGKGNEAKEMSRD